MNTAGHLNVFETSDYVQATDPNYDTLDEFYPWLAAQPEAIGQFNHPYEGMDFNRFAYHAHAARRISLVELTNAPYADSLPPGWRVGAVANSDTHSPDWGEWRGVTVVAPELTREAILESLRARRVFGVWNSGPTLGVAMRVNDHWMGEVISNTRYLDVEVTLYAPNSEGNVLALILYDNGSPVEGVVPLPWQPVFTWHTRIAGAANHFYYVEALVRSDAYGSTWTGYTAPVWTDDTIPERTYVYLPVVIKD